MVNGRLIKTEYKPNDKQLLGHASRARRTLFGGAWGGGKTRWLAQDGFHFLMTFPGIECFFARYDLAALMKPTQLYEVFLTKIAPEIMVPYQQGGVILQHWKSWPPWIRFTNGSRAIFDGLKDYQASAEFGWVGVDQAEEVPWETLVLLGSRLRQKLPNSTRPPYRMRLTCNPDPGALKENFIDSLAPGCAFIQALASDNQVNLPPDYIKDRREELTPEDYRRYIEGSWEAFVGQALSEFNRSIHVVPYHDDWIKEKWPVWRGIDHGVNHPTVGLWITRDPKESDYYFCMEYDAMGRTAGENAEAIKSMSLGMTLMVSKIDPQTARQGRDSKDPQWSVFKEYNRHGVYCSLAHGDRPGRLAAWKQALQLHDDRRHVVTGLYPAPKFYIMDNCTGLIKTLPELKYKDVVQGYAEDIEKVNDDFYDAGGFILVHLLNQPPPLKTPTVDYMPFGPCRGRTR